MAGYTVVNGAAGSQSQPDTQAFLQLLSQLAHNGAPSPEKELGHAIVRWDEPVFVARAPGRLDVMGGIADYSGSLVLQMPIKEACHVAMQLHGGAANKLVRVVSFANDSGSGRSPTFSCATSALFPDGKPLSYEAARSMFKADAATSWAAYIVGCLLVLATDGPTAASVQERLAGSSVSFLVSSDVPEGKGVSSSAAVEVATMSALAGCLGVTLEGRQLAILCQRVENLVVGAPCGIMDQMASALGQPQSLLALLCQPAEVQGTVSLPSTVAVWGIDSGIRHSVGGSDYGSVRVGAFMGLRICSSVGQPADAAAGPPPPAFGGHLANLSPSLAVQRYEHLLPLSISGKDFLERYATHYDSITTVNADAEYAVRAPAMHPVAEHWRVCTFRSALQLPAGPEQLALLGELMLQSHASYSGCGLGSSGTDRLVELVREEMAGAKGAAGAGAAGHGPLWGAKITGGGCGGTVCVLGEAGPAGEEAVRRVVSRYAAERGVGAQQVKVFEGSSLGAAAFGVLQVLVQ